MIDISLNENDKIVAAIDKKIDDIAAEWNKDGPLEETRIGNQTKDAPKLHGKYYSYLMTELRTLSYLEGKLSILKGMREDYYAGVLSEEDLKKMGWIPYGVRLTKTEIANKIQKDHMIIMAHIRVSRQGDLVNYLQSIIKEISSRSFTIRNYIEYQKFINGG